MELYLHNSIQYFDGAIRPWRFKGRRIRSFNRVVRRLDEQNPHANGIVNRDKRIALGTVLTTFVISAPVGILMMVINKRKRNVEINNYNEMVAERNGIETLSIHKT